MGKTLYLHIGSPKTGTTSIQEMIFANKNKYLEQRVKPIFGNSLNNDEFALYLSVGNKKKADEFISKQLDDKIDSYLLSCEHLFWMGDNYKRQSKVIGYDRSLDILQDIVSKYFDNVVVLIYIRPQSELINSMYIQDVQFMNYKDIDCFSQHYNFDYNSIVSQWENRFTVILRIFSEAIANNSLIEDFNRAIDVDIYVEKESSSNPTLTSRLFYFKREFNRIFDTITFKPNGVNFRIYGYVDILLKKEIESGKPQHIELTKKNCEEIDLKYLESNAILFSKYNITLGGNFGSSELKNKIKTFKLELYDDLVFLTTLNELIEVAGISYHNSLSAEVNRCIELGEVSNDDKLKFCESFFFSEYSRLENERLNISVDRSGENNESESFFSRVVKWIKN